MRRTLVVLGFVAVLALAGLAAVSGGAAEGNGTALEDQIRDQTGATADAMALADDPWVPRTAGLGMGLAVGLLGGGVLAYVVRRDDG